MKPQAQHIAIAEACGKAVSCGSDPYLDTPTAHDWHDWQRQEKPYPFRFRLCKKCPALHIEGERFVSIDSDKVAPDYLNDLNAMHEAEKVLNGHHEQFAYHNHLFDLLPCDENHGCSGAEGDTEDILTPSGFTMLHATAAQRAEAFLRTIGKWVQL